MKVAVCRVAFNERTIRHSRIVKHEVAPCQLHELDRSLRMARNIMRLQLETGDEERHCHACFGCRSAILASSRC